MENTKEEQINIHDEFVDEPSEKLSDAHAVVDWLKDEINVGLPPINLKLIKTKKRNGKDFYICVLTSPLDLIEDKFEKKCFSEACLLLERAKGAAVKNNLFVPFWKYQNSWYFQIAKSKCREVVENAEHAEKYPFLSHVSIKMRKFDMGDKIGLYIWSAETFVGC